MADKRQYDIVLYGATGFTGGLAAEYLAGVAQNTPLSWALAGRNQAKLAAVRAGLTGQFPDCVELPLLAADAGDFDSLRDMAQQARVVMSTVGPYVRYGEPVVRACVEAGTDYVDITGEQKFVDDIFARYHETAVERRLRLISCCGFDSIPHDLGAYFTVKQMDASLPIKLEGFVSSNATFSGGTWHSAINIIAETPLIPQREKSAAKSASSGRRVSAINARPHYEKRIGGWAAPLPTIDPVIVRRSARVLDSYGPDFSYAHYARIGRLPTLVGAGVGVASLVGLAKFKPTRDLLLKVRQPGEGPSAEKRAASKFRVTFIGESGNKSIVTAVSGGDPGYTETSKMISESALCLAHDRDQLPERYGVITTAAAMGDPLLARLQAAGITFEVIRTDFLQQ